VPLVVCGPGDAHARRSVARAFGALGRVGAPPAIEELAPVALWDAALVARVRSLRPSEPFLASSPEESLKELLERLTDAGLGEDEQRALGVVAFLDLEARVSSAHYLRPVERDVAGHVQRRPPAVLAARHPRTGILERFAWAVMPELADRVDRSQADLERRTASRARLLSALAGAALDAATIDAELDAHLRSEPPREPAPHHPPARPSWPSQGSSEPHVH